MRAIIKCIIGLISCRVRKGPNIRYVSLTNFFFYNYDEVILFIHNLLKSCVVITYIMTMGTSECASFIYETVQSFVILSTAAMRTRCLAFKMCTLYPFV